MMLRKISNWYLLNNNIKINIQASVPGDISYDLFSAGVITDPYFGLNHLEHGWIIK